METARQMDATPSETGASFVRVPVKGRRSRPFQAYGCAAGKQSHLGFYDEELDAARAAEAWRRVHLPFAVPDGSLDPLPSCPCRDCRAV